MGELRKDYLLDRWVYIETARGKRPDQFKKDSTIAMPATCSFCPGHEQDTPPEIGRIPKDNGWQMRWFENKYPALRMEGDPHVRTDNRFFTFSTNYGKHEVIVETPDHRQLWDFEFGEYVQLLSVYKQRIETLLPMDTIEYVTVIKNHGREAGASLMHSHSQIFATSKPSITAEKQTIAMVHHKGCAFCDIIAIEKGSYRRCFENETCVAFTPYASRFPMEIWIFPKRHTRSITQFTQAEIEGMADLLRKTLQRLKALNAPYNYYLNEGLEGKDYHVHLEILPRLALHAGFEYSSEMIINPVTPEDAAAFYRGE